MSGSGSMNILKNLANMKPTLAAQNFGHARHGHGSHLADFAMCGTHLETLMLPGLLLSDVPKCSQRLREAKLLTCNINYFFLILLASRDLKEEASMASNIETMIFFFIFFLLFLALKLCIL